MFANLIFLVLVDGLAVT